MLTPLDTTLKEVQGRHAVLESADGQLLKVPADAVKGAEIGAPFTIQILPAEQAVKSQQELARTILNELINQDAQT